MDQRGVLGFSERGVPVAVTEVVVHPDIDRQPLAEAPPRTMILYPDLLPPPSRGELWRAAMAMVEERPILGFGPGTYRRIYGSYIGLTRWDTQIHSNDLYLELAATTGLLGLGAFGAVLVVAIVPQLRAMAHARGRRPTWPALLVGGSLAATVAALAHGFVDYFLVFMPMAVLFWVALGLGTGVALRLASPPTNVQP
jgi:O-antigen ligase